MKNLNFRKQVPKNLAVNILSFIATVIIGLWLTPYLLKNLGIIAYGLIPLAMFLSQYISIILNSINMSIDRFLLVSLQRKSYLEANEIFNTSLVVIAIFIFIQALIMGIILFDITKFFEIPNDLIEDAIWLFGLTFIGFSISLFRSVFGVSLFAYNRLDILRIIDTVQKLVRVLLIVIFFIYDKPSLKYVGVANLLAALSAIIPILYYWKQYTPKLKINIFLFKKDRFLELSKMSIWILINQVGALLLGSIDLYMVNKFIGLKATGEYSIVVQVSSLFRSLATLVAGVISPVIMIYYANNDFDKLKDMVILASKGITTIMLVPLVIIIALSENLLSLWLGNDYTYLNSLISFSLLYYIIAIPIMPLFNINIAYNKVKFPAIVAVCFGILNIISIYLFLTYTNLGLWGIVIMKLLFEILFGTFIIIYVSKILSINIMNLLKIPINSIILFSMVYGVILISKDFLTLDSLMFIIFYSIILFIIITPLLFSYIFSKKEKSFIYKKYKLKTFRANL